MDFSSGMMARMRLLFIAAAIIGLRSLEIVADDSDRKVCDSAGSNEPQCDAADHTDDEDPLHRHRHHPTAENGPPPMAEAIAGDDPRLNYIQYRDHFGDRQRLGFAGRAGQPGQRDGGGGGPPFSTVVLQNHGPSRFRRALFTHLECGHRPSQALNSADRIPAPLN